MLNIKSEIAVIINSVFPEIIITELEVMLEYPPNPEMGDVALPCFKLSKLMRKSPVMIAYELSEKLMSQGILDRAEAVKGYLNIFIDKNAFAKMVLDEINIEGKNYGARNIGDGKTIVVDYSAPNIAKPFHIGHLRSTAIGAALIKLYELMGYKCIGINHLGDWGTQFGKMIVAYKLWGDKEKVEAGGIAEMMRLYVKFHVEAEENPTLDDDARAWFKKMEDGDKEALTIWKWFSDLSLIEFDKIYKRLDVKFDYTTGESFYTDMMPGVVEELKQKKLLVESQGAMVVDLSDYNMPPSLILKSDGATLYPTRDIAAAIYRKKTFDFDKCIYITAIDQALHFAQWFKVVELMGYEWMKDVTHLTFGLVSMDGQKLATRKGKIILMDDVLNEATAKTLETINEKNPTLEDKEAVAEAMGVGAIVFGDLFNNMIKNISFVWDEILNFDGETGPYLQYTHARCCSLIKKAGDIGDWNANITKVEEEALIMELYRYRDKVYSAAMEMEPSIFSRYLIDLAQAFNRFYNACPILTSEPDIKAFRLAIAEATRTVLKHGLYIIGMKAPERV